MKARRARELQVSRYVEGKRGGKQRIDGYEEKQCREQAEQPRGHEGRIAVDKCKKANGEAEAEREIALWKQIDQCSV